MLASFSTGSHFAASDNVLRIHVPWFVGAQNRVARQQGNGCFAAQIFVDQTLCFVQTYKTREQEANAMTRNPNMREAILSAAELLFSTRGFNAVSIRDIALEAGANPGSITYHFKSKDGLLLEIYKRHCGPMNKRRIELLVAARRVRDVQDRLEAIVRAYVQPAFSSSSDLAGGGARFTRLRAVMSAEGNVVVGRIIAEIFDDTTNAFIGAIEESLPHLPRTTIVWRSQFLLGALYYTLVSPERVTRLSRGEADGADMAEAIEQLVSATVASLQAADVDHIDRGLGAGSRRAKPAQPSAEGVAAKQKANPVD
jgi:AcrR family transcriptional regulator